MALVAVAVAIAAFTVWLGLYLIARQPAAPRLRLAGAGLLAYGMSVGLDTLVTLAQGSVVSPAAVSPGGPALADPAHEATLQVARWLGLLLEPLLFVPALCWAGALAYLLPEESPWRATALRAWWRLALPLGLGLLLLGLLTGAGASLMGSGASGLPAALHGAVRTAQAVVAFGALLGALLFAWRARAGLGLRVGGAVLAAATLFFGLGSGLVLLPLEVVPRGVGLLLIAVDVVAFGVLVARFDALDLGEAFLPDCLRSLALAAVTAGFLGAQVGLAALAGAGPPFLMVALLLGVVWAAIAFQTCAGPLQTLLDRIVFARLARLREERAELRAAADAAARTDPDLDPAALDDAEFVRLTRRALSHYADLGHLAASPLARLPVVTCRLRQRGATDNTLERARELKALLTESIARLKPAGADFGTSAEWRHYNALYFPYIVGLRPYSRRPAGESLDPAARAALDWFQREVPERTLHNWQNAAARLVAQDLRQADAALRAESAA